jgi:uncharacterized membrane protein YtjA (UPF0391 family)
MLSWAIAFFILALVAAFLGVSGIIVGAAVNIAWVLLVLFAIAFIVSLFLGRRGRGAAPPPRDDLM